MGVGGTVAVDVGVGVGVGGTVAVDVGVGVGPGTMTNGSSGSSGGPSSGLVQDFPLCAVAVQAVPAVVIGMTWTRKSATWSRSIPPPPLLYEKVTEVGPLPLERAIQLSPVGTLTTLVSSTS